jgi:two-component system, OmpR family, response regulator VicR
MSAAVSPPAQSSSPTVLVVDDNQGVVEFLKLLLSKSGMNVTCATSGRECLELARSRSFDLVILDVMMPVMDGLEVCRELKKLNPSLPVILLTAKDDMDTRAAAMDLGVSEFVAKPVNNRDLLARVRTQIREHQWGKKVDEAVSSLEQAEPQGSKEK